MMVDENLRGQSYYFINKGFYETRQFCVKILKL